MKKKSAPGRLLFRFFTSGKFSDFNDEVTRDAIVRYVALNVAYLLGCTFLIVFGVSVLLSGETARAGMDLSIAVLGITAMILLRYNVPFIIPGLMAIVPFGGLCVMLNYSGGAQGFAGLWLFAYPLISIFILGIRIGTGLSLAVLVFSLLVFFIPNFGAHAYDPAVAFRFGAVYLLILVLAVAYEEVRIFKDQWVKRLTRQLQVERDEMATMKDNLRIGLFLMNRDLLIQSQYSRALEEVLSLGALQGRKFTELLSSSIRTRELEILKDYFDMIFNRAFDQKMLEEINPIHEFTYVSIEGGEERTLRSGFVPVDRENGEVFILGTIQDITGETKLQKQLAEEEGKRQEEMRSLFDVIQIDQKVFNDFIEDTEYEFDRINSVLKKTELSSQEALVEMYQSVHAIKSNAIILGLANFGDKLHELEDQIKNLREQESISFENVLHITVELEKLMKEKDKFQETIGKIRSFNAGAEQRKKDEDVFIETLSKAGQRAAEDLQKKVSLEVNRFDPAVLENGPRRVMKEVLTQLVRNAVYHGIEAPEKRLEAGKNEAGHIQLSLVMEGDSIHIILKDDGAGLDFNRIGEKAKAMGLVTNPEDLEDEQFLSRVIFMPAFSTAETETIHAGRGIGLNLVQDRINEVKGAIKLQTEKGKGTSFEIFIRVVQ